MTDSNPLQQRLIVDHQDLEPVAGILDDPNRAIAKLRLEILFPKVGRLHHMGVAINNNRIRAAHPHDPNTR